MPDILKQDNVESKLLTIRNQQVILDSDVADLYGVETKRINEAVKNNPEKFPTGYYFELFENEKTEVVEIFDHLHKLKFSANLPKAFTEKGLYMLATILRSKKATETTIEIVETFAKLRQLTKAVVELSKSDKESEQTTLIQRGSQLISEILGDELEVNGTETSIELNLAVFKIKHTIKRKGNLDVVKEEEPIYIRISK